LKKRFRWQVSLGVTLFAIAVFFYLLHFVIFRDSYFIFKYVVAQLGFLPISVLLVTLVLNQLLVRREKRALLKKLNMVKVEYPYLFSLAVRTNPFDSVAAP
jgi:hypothetical protein